MNLFRSLLISVFGVMLPLLSHASDELCATVDNTLRKGNLIPYLYYFRDTTKSVTQPWNIEYQSKFVPLESEDDAYNFGANDDAHWIKFCLINKGEKQNIVFAFGPALLHEFDFYSLKDGKNFITGSSKPFDTRDIHSPEYHFNIFLEGDEKADFYIRFRASRNAFLRASVWSIDAYQVDKDYHQGMYGIFTGIFLGLVLYNLMLYLTTRQMSSMWYISFATSVFFVLAFFDGRMLQYVFPDSPELSYRINLLNYLLISIFGALFSRSFLKLKRYPFLDRLGLGLIAIFTLLLPPLFLVDVSLYQRGCTVFTIAGTVYFGIICSMYTLFNGSIEARYYFLGQSPFMLTIFERGLYNLGIISHYYLPYEPKAGLASSMILLAYGVGRMILKDKEQAQKQALEQLKISNELKSNYNAKLEKEIEENTTEIRHMNQDLEGQAKQLLELDRIKSRFFANISHEFRTPLTLIEGPLISLLKEEKFPKKDVLNGVIRQSKQLRQLIDQLLTLSRFDNDSVNLQAAKTDLVRKMSYLTSQFESLAAREEVSLQFNCAHEAMYAYVDNDKFEIIINNLLSNALKFTPNGGKVLVSMTSSLLSASEERGNVEDFPTDQYVEIVVSDSGSGIAEEDLPHIFDRYYQARSNKSSFTGTGIGLSLVQELVRLHIGTVDVNSIEGVGTQFTLRFPLGNSHLKPAEIVEAPPASFELETSCSLVDVQPLSETIDCSADKDKSKTVLIVDDNHDMRDYLRTLLEASYQIVEAENGEVAEQVLHEHNPDIVITDLMMPKKDGLAFVKSVRAGSDHKTIPIIMLTAKAGQEDKLKGLQAAADDYLAKPFDADELKIRIHNLILKKSQWDAFYGVRETDKEGSLHGLETEQNEHAFIEKARRIVEQNLADDTFGVEELASELFMSAPTLRRRLSDISSFTPSGFIRHCRLEKARQYIRTGEYRTIETLARAVGFNQANYFSRLYRKTFNESPLAAPSQNRSESVY